LLHLIGGMDRATRGRVLLGGVALDKLSEEELTTLRRGKIGFVFQAFNLLPTLTVSENVALPLMLAGADERIARDKTQTLLERVGLGPRSEHFPAELSGGEMQRTAVARAVIASPEIVLADEPTGNLDSENGEQVMRLLADLNGELGITVILATHSEEAALHTRRTIRMRDGLIERIVEHEGLLQTL
ncbi:MAG TPA: ABC transporter ATP-binding protein, partial [Blastocatellia bacterium]|nr:ABC transporter ATP-binding protein [Blastocatellia bacterium]